MWPVLLEVFGWVGSGLVVLSLAQSNALRLHVLNVIACGMLVAYNAVLSVYPMVGLNVALCAVNSWRIWVILRERRRARATTGAGHAE